MLLRAVFPPPSVPDPRLSAMMAQATAPRVEVMEGEAWAAGLPGYGPEPAVDTRAVKSLPPPGRGAQLLPAQLPAPRSVPARRRAEPTNAQKQLQQVKADVEAYTNDARTKRVGEGAFGYVMVRDDNDDDDKNYLAIKMFKRMKSDPVQLPGNKSRRVRLTEAQVERVNVQTALSALKAHSESTGIDVVGMYTLLIDNEQVYNPADASVNYVPYRWCRGGKTLFTHVENQRATLAKDVDACLALFEAVAIASCRVCSVLWDAGYEHGDLHMNNMMLGCSIGKKGDRSDASVHVRIIDFGLLKQRTAKLLDMEFTGQNLLYILNHIMDDVPKTQNDMAPYKQLAIDLAEKKTTWADALREVEKLMKLRNAHKSSALRIKKP